MHNPWKLATLGLVALGVTVGTSTLTTAYLMRPPMVASEGTHDPVAAPLTPPRRPIVRVAPAPKRYAAAPIAARITPAAAETAAAPPAVARTPVASSTASRPADCTTGGDRALRIAKPGALGAVLGAGLGAAGGAVANGGKGAGQGALIGGLAGAALGSGYGAYTTNKECGTVFGAETAPTVARTAPAGAPAPLQSTVPGAARIEVYEVR